MSVSAHPRVACPYRSEGRLVFKTIPGPHCDLIRAQKNVEFSGFRTYSLQFEIDRSSH